MRMKNVLPIVLGCVGVLMHAVLAWAIMWPLSTELLSRSADVVVRGHVDEVASEWNSDATLVVTSALVWVEEVVRGELDGPDRRIVVEYPGGTAPDGVTQGVSDGVILSSGDTVVLFLRRAESVGRGAEGPVYHVVGAAQGVYRVDARGTARKQGYAVVLPDGRAVDVGVETGENHTSRTGTSKNSSSRSGTTLEYDGALEAVGQGTRADLEAMDPRIGLDDLLRKVRDAGEGDAGDVIPPGPEAAGEGNHAP